jgi:hypothetical protein
MTSYLFTINCSSLHTLLLSIDEEKIDDTTYFVYSGFLIESEEVSLPLENHYNLPAFSTAYYIALRKRKAYTPLQRHYYEGAVPLYLIFRTNDEKKAMEKALKIFKDTLLMMGLGLIFKLPSSYLELLSADYVKLLKKWF